MPQSVDEHAEPPLDVERIARSFDLPPDRVCEVTHHFVRQMRDGLVNRRTWQLPSYVRAVPTGREKGQFLAVDLGGSNCRICLVNLHGDSTFSVVQSKHTVPAEVMVNQSYRPVFAFIAKKISDFLVAHLDSRCDAMLDVHDSRKSRYQMGFAFSFNCEQTSLARGALIRWDKGWNIPEAVGGDPCEMLQEAIDNLRLPVHVSALANDSVGTLLARAYTSSHSGSTLGAVIFGTGTNAAYIEKLSNVRWMTAQADAGDIMVINTEWGCFDEELQVLPRTRYDQELDARSIDPGSQMFEKCVSGMYLGELLRLVILQLLADSILQMKVDPGSRVLRHGGIDSSFLSQLASDCARRPEEAKRIVSDNLSARNVTLADVRSIQVLASAIARRAARLAGASLAAIIIQSGRLEQSQPSAKTSAVESKEYRPQFGPNSLPNGRFRYFRARIRLLLGKVLAFLGINSLVASPRGSASLPPVPGNATYVFEDEIIDIGADGSLIELYPTFEADMRSAIREIPGIGEAGERRIRIGLAKDGSGVGAALMAQAALKFHTKTG